VKEAREEKGGKGGGEAGRRGGGKAGRRGKLKEARSERGATEGMKEEGKGEQAGSSSKKLT
jgi:hypothetical protein